MWGRMREDFMNDGGTPAHADPARVYGIKRVSSLATLPYWLVQHRTPPLLLILLFPTL
jgi:hypothetical protein